MLTDHPTLLLVGNRFSGFSAAHPEVLTVSEFIRHLRNDAGAPRPEHLTLQPGQGIGESQWDLLRLEIAERGLSHRIHLLPALPAPAGRHETHKHLEVNRLIASPRMTGPGRYRADLRVHNDNELLIDHQTGQHVQGMVAVEAARQMFLTVTERFLLPDDRERYFVINSLDTEFENFLFPLAAEIDYRIVESDTADPDRLSFTVEIGIEQAGRRCTRTEVRFTAFENRLIESKEQRRAEKALAAVVERREGAYADAAVH
ncbi:AfsA-related hotdog domain-containing protein [Glycomyces luteolus]|uniref:AfsA-related hotdog domain-containing protein n=1 Tax=Glycomyces luteolus TaxID=2670330 RepID=A0A9X3SPE4_9ACTN|nr:AfsA-related hotdog domain-containing protein [Glycomyces luteolus]MDA1358871.1 AfsA-related hotdog domain-containing protein [Glycomyces luteolus]